MQLSVGREVTSQRWLLAACFFLIVVCIGFLFSSTSGEIAAKQPSSVTYFVDKSGQLSLNEIQELPAQQWQSVDASISLGMSRDTYWFAVALPTSKSIEERYLLEISYPLLDNVDLWIFDSKTSEQPHSAYSVGDSRPFSERPMTHETFLFPLPQNADGELFSYIKVQTQGSIKVPIQIWTEQSFTEHTAKLHVTVGLFFGILIAMALSNFFFFLTTRNITFLVYTAYVISLSLVLVSLQGFGFEYLWPNNLWLQERAIALFANASIMFAMFFSDLLLNLKSHSKKVSRFVNTLGWLFFINVLVSLLLPYYYLIQIFLVLLLFVVGVIFGVGIWLSLKNIIIARYYTLAWLVLLVSAFAAALDNLNFIQIAIPSTTLMLYGAVAETLLLAFVLAMSYGYQRDDLEKAQTLALDREKEIASAKDKLLSLEQQAKDELEYKVQERTLELEITLRELSDANQELERLNTIDPLTNIRNRRYFDKRIIAEGRRSRREQTTLSLVMLDIDRFKSVNDQYGHDVGDKCIQHVANIAKSCLKRTSDDVCRYGGEEFAFILPNTEREGAMALIESIRVAIQNTPWEQDDQSISLTVSAGVSCHVVTSEEGEKLILKQADQALYQAKAEGRNRVIMAREEE